MLEQHKPRLTGIMPRLHGCMHAIDPLSECHECALACPTGCITFPDGYLRIDQSRCDGCEKCVAACPHASQQPREKDPHSIVHRMRERIGVDQIYER